MMQLFSRNTAVIVGRTLLATIFLISAYQTGQQFHSAVADLAQSRVPLPTVALTLALAAELIGASSVMLGIRQRWGAVLLILFIVPVTVVYHPFWLYGGARRDAQFVHFLKNIAILGGLLLITSGCGKPYSSESSGVSGS